MITEVNFSELHFAFQIDTWQEHSLPATILAYRYAVNFENDGNKTTKLDRLEVVLTDVA